METLRVQREGFAKLIEAANKQYELDKAQAIKEGRYVPLRFDGAK